MASRRPSANTIAHAFLVLAGVSLTIALNLTPIYTNDFWIQLKVGDMIRETGEIPRTVLFTFTEARDNPFYAHEWLPSVVSSALYSRIAYEGMIVVKCVLALAIFALAWLLAFQISRTISVSVLVASLTILAINFRTQMRPEIFAFVFALASLNLLEAFRRSGNWTWLLGLVPVSLVWANAHGSFLLNPILPALFLAGTAAEDGWRGRIADRVALRRRAIRVYLPLAVAVVAVAAVDLINPWGWRLPVHVFSFGRAEYLRDLNVEFGATFDERIRKLFYFKVYLAYLAVVIASFVPGRKRLTGVALALFVAFFYLSTDAIRFTAWFGIVGTYVLATNLAGIARESASRTALATTLGVVLVVGVLNVVEKGNIRGMPIGFTDKSPLPREAIEAIRREGIEGNVFNSFNHADQLVYHFYPRIRVAIDSRVDAYGEAYYRRYLSMDGRSYKLLGPPEDLVGFLDRYGVETIVTRPYDYNNWDKKGHLARLSEQGWRLVYRDAATVILRRGNQGGRGNGRTDVHAATASSPSPTLTIAASERSRRIRSSNPVFATQRSPWAGPMF